MRLLRHNIKVRRRSHQMRKSKFTESQIIKFLKEAEAGKTVNEVCREHGLSRSTFYRWQALYSDMTVSELNRMNELEKENRRLKQMYADTSLENMVLKEMIEKKF
jgi:putative transposase